MRLSELIVKRKTTRFSSAVPLLLHIYMDAHNWNADDYIGETYHRKKDYIINNILVANIKKKKIVGNLIYSLAYDADNYPVLDENTGYHVEELDLEKSDVNIIDLIHWIVDDLKDISLIPDDLLIAAGIESPKRNRSDSSSKADPKIAAELGSLRLEKDKWDASIDAATKIGLLFYEKGLEKQPTKEAFIKAFVEHLGDELPGSTIERIYKALPSGYKQLGGRPKKDTATENIDNVIQAAAFAGTLHEAPVRLKISNLRDELKDIGISVPDDSILKKIIDAIKNLDI